MLAVVFGLENETGAADDAGTACGFDDEAGALVYEDTALLDLDEGAVLRLLALWLSLEDAVVLKLSVL